MNCGSAKSALIEVTATEVADLQTMRRSFRCFWFGVGALLPVMGAGLAWQALALEREIFGARLRKDFRWAVWGALILAAPFLFVSMNWPPVAIVTLVVAAADAGNDFWRRRMTGAARWNPAANWAWGGGTLARIGLGGTAIVILGALSDVFDFIVLGA